MSNLTNLTSVLAITAILVTPVFAENSHQHGDNKQGCEKGMDNQKMKKMKQQQTDSE